MTRALAIVAAFAGATLAANADPWAIPAGQYFASQRASVAVYGSVPKYHTKIKPNRAQNVVIVHAAARAEGVPVAFAHRLIQRESGFNHLARSPVGAMGIGQMMPGTWRSERCTGSPWNPTDNARCSMRYLAKFYRQGGEHYAALRYHGGPNTRQHGPKTREYAAAVAGKPPKWAGTLIAMR